MLQISNIDDGKSEWNLNETHIIIPVIDGDMTSKESDKTLTNTLTLSSFDSGDQTVLGNSLEHSFVIGLDRNLFETPSFKSDLVIIQNSDLKFSSGPTDLKNSVAYAISYVDQDKNEIFWRAPISKDRICTSDKAILEVRNVLNYDDSVHVLEKAEEQINVNTDIPSQVDKTDNESLLEKTISNEKKLHYLNYFAATQNAVTIPIVEQINTSKPSLNLEIEETEKKVEEILDYKSHLKLNAEGDCRIVENAQGNIYDMSKSLTELQSFKIIECKIDEEKNTILNKNRDDTVGDADKEKISEKGSNFLLEKSLPLKKKAKMKRTLTLFSYDNQKSLLKQDVVAAYRQVDMKFSTGKKIKQPSMTPSFFKDAKSNPYEPLINKMSKGKKATEFKINSKKLHQKEVTSFLPEGDKIKSQEVDNKTLEENEVRKTDISGFEKNKFNTINDLIDCLRKCRMINAAVWQILNSGLKEMKVDILKEMNAKKCSKNFSENRNYSPELKAFALVLHFKQPAAFNYLSQAYKNGWPSLNVIKKWKRRMNSYQRPNFVRAEKNTESCTF